MLYLQAATILQLSIMSGKKKLHHPPPDWATLNYHAGVVKPLDLVVVATPN